MTRRSYRLIGGEGTFDVEAEQHPDGHIEVAEIDRQGKQQNVVIVHSWDEAKSYAAEMVRDALIRGDV